MAWPGSWWRRRSLRARLTLITSAGLALALAGAAVLLVNALRVSLIRGLDDSARQGALTVAALIDGNRLPSPVPVAPGTITIQVLDAQGRITDVSPGADRLVPMLAPAQAQAAARTGQGSMLNGPPLGMRERQHGHQPVRAGRGVGDPALGIEHLDGDRPGGDRNRAGQPVLVDERGHLGRALPGRVVQPADQG